MKLKIIAHHALAVLLLVCFSAELFAQVSVTPEQMRMFQSLSPEQRAAILQQLGGNVAALPAPVSGEESAADGEGLAEMLLPGISLEPEEEEELRIEGADTIVVISSLQVEETSPEAGEFMSDINRSRLLGSRVLQLDKRGVLELPGIGSIPLAGLSAEEIAVRLKSEPLLAALEIEVTILPLIPSGSAALKPFGIDIFTIDEDEPGFGSRPLSTLPAPEDYVLGPGDTLNLQLYGNENYSVALVVSRDGTINFPKLGPRTVAGMTYGDLKKDIEERVDEQLIGTEASVTLGQLRSIRVFVVGDVKKPGAYTMSSLSRITTALSYSGGITEIGSLRNVQLKRSGRQVGTFDIYDLLLKGDTRNDSQLRADDVVFVPPARRMVGVDGEVMRPALYELKSERTVRELLGLAGELSPAADVTAIQLERVLDDGTRSVETINLRNPEDANLKLEPGDFVTVFPALKSVQDGVYLSGHTERPGDFEWFSGMKIIDLIPSEKYLRPKSDLGYVLIRREYGPDRQTKVLSVDLRAAWAAPGSAANLALQPRDRITVFELGVARSAAIKAILSELQAQSSREQPLRQVTIAGQVRATGAYPLEAGMRVSDLLRAGGGLSDSAYAESAELTRYIVGINGERETELLEVDLAAAMSGNVSADLLLQPYDFLNVKEIPAWAEQLKVVLEGEVRFPGVYPARRGETLKSVLERAGGLTELAFPKGSVFTRESLQERESQQLKTLESRLEADLAGLALQAAADPTGNSQQAMSVGQSLLEQIRTSTPTGRLVIDLDKLAMRADRDQFDIVLRDGDRLLVPQKTQEVTVLGEVQYSTSHLFEPGQARDSYIGLSGGLTANADPKRIYVVRASGAVVAGQRSRWFRGGGTRIEPGDTIVVPMDTDRQSNLRQWTSVTQIIYNLAIAVAAVNSF